MKKYIVSGILTILMIVGVVVFANGNITNKANNCPDRPGCICSKNTTKQVVKTNANSKDCPDKPGCICSK